MEQSGGQQQVNGPKVGSCDGGETATPTAVVNAEETVNYDQNAILSS